MQIIPAILTESREELLQRLVEVRSLGLMVQIDFADGQFVESQSLPPEDLPPEILTIPWEAHLMTENPQNWSRRLYGHRPSRIYWHVEALSSGRSIPHRLSAVEHAVALRLETPLSALDPFITMVDSVLLLSIARPGYQGERFEEAVFDKIKELKKAQPRIKITVDGGIKLEHFKPLVAMGVDRAVVGSGFWQYKDLKSVLGEYRKASLLDAQP